MTRFLPASAIVVCVSGCATTRAPENYEISPQRAVKSLDDGKTIRGFEFNLVGAKTNYVTVSIYYLEKGSRKIRQTNALRQGDYFPENEEYAVASVTCRPKTIGTPETGLAAVIVTDAIIRHRTNGATYLLRDLSGNQSVQKLD